MKLPCSSGNPVLINSRKSPRNRSDNNNGRACRRRSLIAWSVCGMVLWNTAGTFRMNYHGLPIPCNTQKNISSSVVRRVGVSLLRDRLKGQRKRQSVILGDRALYATETQARKAHASPSSSTQRRISTCGSGGGVLRSSARSLHRAGAFGALLNPEVASVEYPGTYPTTLGRIPRR